MTLHRIKKQFFLRRQRLAVVCVLCLFLSCTFGCGGNSQKLPAAAPSDIPVSENEAGAQGLPDTAISDSPEHNADTMPSHTESDKEAPDTPDASDIDDTTVTFMVYMDAASLESGEAPFATYDLMQMMEAELSDHVRVIVQTGGTRIWGRSDGISTDAEPVLADTATGAEPVLTDPEMDAGTFVTDTSEISSDSTQRYEIIDHGMMLLDDLGEQRDMTDAQTLKEFLLFCAQEAPADRYMLLLWGHGRGPVIGYGQDDFQGFHSAMTLTALADAVHGASEEGGFTIELIGFDACLMGCVETVHALRGCCAYLAVSEDYEPAYGWQYTRVFDALSEYPSIPIEQFAQVIVDAYMEEAERSGDRGILAVIDMQYADALWEAWRNFYDTNVANMNELIHQVWHDHTLLSPVPDNPNGYVSDDDQYSLQDYGLTDLAALCYLAPSAEADAVLALLAQSLTAVDSFHMARMMCGLAVCP
ncbi:MAG: hypothetical protein HDQ98_06690 [Lachnospiraceae bacterium]|nr:hypothetical protein [Lachnospiraceae bacterium]